MDACFEFLCYWAVTLYDRLGIFHKQHFKFYLTSQVENSSVTDDQGDLPIHSVGFLKYPEESKDVLNMSFRDDSSVSS